ncbi:MAG: 4-hydroxybenzoate 3-monooxygenase [Burkholderiaceae bacterium]|jgi:p-hydroxybenzoate 3-monooxygenase
MQTHRTQVGIVGAGPAGLLLAHLLHRQGIASVVLELKSRQYVQERIRAGVLEHGTVDLLNQAGVGARMMAQGLPHEGIELLFDGKRHRIDLSALTGGRRIMVYGQHEVVKDLIAARESAGAPILYEVEDLNVADIQTEHPKIRCRHAGEEIEWTCDFIAGCDGFHGVCRDAIPAAAQKTFERVYPFAWLGILVKAPPASDELIYASHESGFALFSMRSTEITRLYLQCTPDDDLARWPDERIWDELDKRLACDDGWQPHQGEIMQKSITPMRSFVCETMQTGRLFLAGDAAHIVPPTGAKGMNLAVSDIRYLSRALVDFYAQRGESGLRSYSETCLKRIWRAEHFSWWMTSMLHRFADHSPFEQRIQSAELAYFATSRAGSTAIAENYVGLPWTD